MHANAVFLLILTCLFVTGCNKSEQPAATATESPQAQTPVQTPAPAKPVVNSNRSKIVVFGDSLTEGGFGQGKSYTDYLQHLLDAKGFPYQIVNQGISGDTTTGGLGRIQSVVDEKPEIAILELGGNDGLRGLPVSATKDNLEQMIQILQKAGIRVVLAGMTLPPNYGADYIRPFEQMYKELAAKYKLTFIPFLLVDIAKQLSTRRDLLNADGIHPTSAGNEIVAATVLKTLEPLLHH